MASSTSGFVLLLSLGTLLCIATRTGGENTPPYIISQPAELVNQTLQAAPTTWQSVMQPLNWWPNLFLFVEASSLFMNIPCNVGGTGPFTCTWYRFNASALGLTTSTPYVKLTTNDYDMGTYNGGTNCLLAVPVIAVALNYSFFCSAISSATNIPAISDPVAFLSNPTASTASKTLSGLVINQYSYVQNTALLYPSFNTWYAKATTSCNSVQCTQSFDSTRFITDEAGNLHILSLQSTDIPTGYTVVCDSRIGTGYLQTTAVTTIYTPNPIATGQVSTSTTATLKYVSGAGAVSTSTASGTLKVYEGQMAVSLACVYANKATAISVVWAINGTVVATSSTGNSSSSSSSSSSSGAYVITEVQLYSGGTYTCYEVASPSAVSTINLVVIPKLRWLAPKKMAYLVLGSGGYIEANNSIGPSTITYSWSVNGQQAKSTAGWSVSTSSRITFAGPAMQSSQSVVQLQLQSGSQLRNYAIAVLVVNPMSLGVSPFSSSPLFVSLSGSTTVTASGTGDSRVNDGQVAFAWIFQQIPLSRISTNTTCNVSSNDTNYWPPSYLVLWNNGTLVNNTNVSLPALSFAKGSNSASMTWNQPINKSVIDNYRGCYCVKAYNDAEGRFQCAVIVFSGDAIAGAVVAAAGFPWWAILLLVVVPILILCCIFCIVFFCCWWCRRRRREGVYRVEKREIHEGNDPVSELRESGFRPQEPGVNHPLDPKTQPEEETEDEEEPTANVPADKVPLTTSAPVTYTARPPPPPSVNGSRPPVYGDRMYMAASAFPQPSNTPRTTSPPPPPSRQSNLSNVDGPEPPRRGNAYGYSAPLPQPPTQLAPLPAYANPPGALPPRNGSVSPRATLTYAPPSTQLVPGQPLPTVHFYSSTQPPPLAAPPRRTSNRDSLV